MTIFHSPLEHIGDKILTPVSFNPDLELVMVMIIIPVTMNAAYFWITDNYLKAHKNKIVETENKNKYCDKNNNIFVQQVINYNLHFYNYNKNKFVFDKDKIFYNNTLFFEGKFDMFNLVEGKLYDLVSSRHQFPSYFIKKNNVLIYEGQFKNNKPNGYGIGYSLWNMINYNLVGLWFNGNIKDIVNFKEYHSKKNNHTIEIIEYSNDNSFLDGLKENNYKVEIVNEENEKIIHLKIKIL